MRRRPSNGIARTSPDIFSGSISSQHRLVRRRTRSVGDRTDQPQNAGVLLISPAKHPGRQRAAREGHCFQHVQAITIAIDQYAEKTLGNRDYFLNKPYGVG